MKASDGEIKIQENIISKSNGVPFVSKSTVYANLDLGPNQCADKIKATQMLLILICTKNGQVDLLRRWGSFVSAKAVLREASGEFNDIEVAVIEHNMSPTMLRQEKINRNDEKPVFCARENEICQCEETGSVFMGEKVSVVGGQDVLDTSKSYKAKNFQSLVKVPCDASFFDIPSGDCFCGKDYVRDKGVEDHISIT